MTAKTSKSDKLTKYDQNDPFWFNLTVSLPKLEKIVELYRCSSTNSTKCNNFRGNRHHLWEMVIRLVQFMILPVTYFFQIRYELNIL